MITIGGKQNGTPESPRLPSEAVIAPEIRESADLRSCEGPGSQNVLCVLTLPL
jgi:hypothetical protein